MNNLPPHPRLYPWPSLARIAAVAALLSPAACSPRVESQAVGKWQVEGSPETLEFRQDGSCQGIDSYGRAVTGKFAFLDVDHIKLELTSSSTNKDTGTVSVDTASGTCQFEVQGDLLSLTELDGRATRYHRAK